jgi:hypothetical protein
VPVREVAMVSVVSGRDDWFDPGRPPPTSVLAPRCTGELPPEAPPNVRDISFRSRSLDIKLTSKLEKSPNIFFFAGSCGSWLHPNDMAGGIGGRRRHGGLT